MDEKPMVIRPIDGEPVVIGAKPVHLRWVDGPVCGRRGYVLELDGQPMRGVQGLEVFGRAGGLCDVRFEMVAVSLDLDLKVDLHGQVIKMGDKRYRLIEED